MRNNYLDLTFDLINVFKNVHTPYETALLIQDLFTATEIKNLAKRLRIAKMLLSGISQRDVAKKLRSSIATVTKVSIWLKKGGEGLRLAIDKLPRRYTFPKNLPPIPIEFHLPRVLLTIAQYSLAKNQKEQIDKLGSFLDFVKEKEFTDKQLREYFSEQYREKKDK